MFVKYIIGLIVGWLIGSIGIINIITILRFGIPSCNVLIKEKADENAKKLKNTYFISLLIWTIIISIVTFLCYKFLGNAFITYIIAIIIMVLLGFRTTGENDNNISDFNDSLNNKNN